MFFGALKSKITAAMAMLGGLTASFSGSLPPESAVAAQAALQQRGNNRRIPRLRDVPNYVKQWDGSYRRSDNESLSIFTPGSKLARKAAEGRLGLYAGRK